MIEKDTDMSEKLFREGDGIDEKTCLQMYDNSYDFYIAVLNTFIKEIEKTITGMNEYQKRVIRKTTVYLYMVLKAVVRAQELRILLKWRQGQMP